MSRYPQERKRIKAHTSTTPISAKEQIALTNRLPQLLAARRYQELLDICETLLSADQNNYIALRNQSHALFMLGDHEQALVGYKAVCQITPDAQSYAMQGKIQHYFGRYEQALDCYKASLKLDANDVNTLIGQGDVFYAMADAKNALSSFEKAYQLQPKNFFNLTSIGIVLSDLGRHEEALQHLKTAYKLNSRYETNLLALGAVLVHLKRPNDALSYLVPATQLFPNNIEAHLGAGLAFHHLALNEKPHDDKAKLGYSWNQQAALKYYESALAIDPEFSQAVKLRNRLLSQVDKQAVVTAKLSSKETKQRAMILNDLPLERATVDHLTTAVIMPNTQSLTSLSLANTQLTDSSFGTLMFHLQYCHFGLTYLDLSHNFLTDRSIKSLAQRWLYENSPLQILKLSHNKITAEGLQALIASVAKHKTLSLRIIDLEDNFIEIAAPELKAIKASISHHKNLEDIKLAGNKPLMPIDSKSTADSAQQKRISLPWHHGLFGSSTIITDKDRKESKTPQLLTEKNRVIIRVWTSRLNGGRDVGHVSIEASERPQENISLYPSIPIGLFENGLAGLLYPVAPLLKKDYKGDLDEERRHCEIVICLYSLNIDNLYYEYYRKTKSADFKGWMISGPNIINGYSAESCASLAHAVLKAAGMYKLLGDYQFDYDYSIAVTPDDLAALVATAKNQELIKYPETRNFKFDKETNIDKLTSKTYKSGACPIL